MVLFLIRFLNIRGESSTTECLKVCPKNLKSTCNKKNSSKIYQKSVKYNIRINCMI